MTDRASAAKKAAVTRKRAAAAKKAAATRKRAATAKKAAATRKRRAAGKKAAATKAKQGNVGRPGDSEQARGAVTAEKDPWTALFDAVAAPEGVERFKQEMLAEGRKRSPHLTEAQLEASWKQMAHQFGFYGPDRDESASVVSERAASPRRKPT